MLIKIISGGQTGADYGGLVAGLKAGYRTGGTAPKGFKTECGANPNLALLFRLKEHESEQYPPRTEANVNEADGTIRFAVNFESPGEKCTLKAIQKAGKLHIDVDVKKPIPHQDVADWLFENDIRILNVAGNCESTHKGLEKFVVGYLTKVFELLPAKPNFQFFVVVYNEINNVAKLVGPFQNGRQILAWKKDATPYVFKYQILEAETPES